MLRQVYLPGGGVITAALNFPAKMTAGIAQAIITRLVASNVGVGVSCVLARIRNTVGTNSGLAVSTFSSGTAKVASQNGVAQKVSMTLAGMPQNSGVSVNKTKFGLVHHSGSNSATNIGTNAWTNPANAQGLRNGSNATCASDTLNTRSYQLRLQYADFTNKSLLTITKVELRFSCSQAGTLLGNGNLQTAYRFSSGAAWTTLETRTANFNDISGAAKVYDITAAVGGDWSKLDGLETRVMCALPAAVIAINCACDAVTVYIEATREDDY